MASRVKGKISRIISKIIQRSIKFFFALYIQKTIMKDVTMIDFVFYGK